MDPRMPQMCPICTRPAQLQDNESAIDVLSVNCTTCGNFSLPGLLHVTFFDFHNSESTEKALFPYLSAHTRQAWERGEEIFLNNDNWKTFAQSHANISVARKLERLLELMAARSKPGLPVNFDDKTDPPLVDAVRAQELSWMLGNLGEVGYVTRVGNWSYALKPKGWEKIQASSLAGVPGKCFVAMSFDPTMNDAFTKGIEPAVSIDCKMDPIRLDFVQHNEKICCDAKRV